MDFRLTTLGISAAGPVPGRWPSGQYLNAGGLGFLIDCGEGIQIALQKNKIGWSSIDFILISHLHGDHIYGLPGLLSSWGLNNRTTPLTIVSPVGLKTILEGIFENSYSFLSFPVQWIFTNTNKVSEQLFENAHIDVHSLRLKHRIPTTGFLIVEKQRPRTILKEAIQKYQLSYEQIRAVKNGEDLLTEGGINILNSTLTKDPPPNRSFAYCSDTSPNAELIPYIEKVDLLFHEATFLDELSEQAKISGHTTALQAAQVAKQAKVGKLVLGHFSPRYINLNVFLNEARPVFEKTFLAKEGVVFDVPFAGRDKR